MKVYVLLLMLIVLSVLSAPIVYAQRPVPPPMNMNSSMKVLVYPDGAIRVLYSLDVFMRDVVENTIGNILLSYREESTEDHMFVVFSGVGEVKPLSPGMEVSSSSFSTRSLFNIHGSSEGYIINGSIIVKANSTMGVERNHTVINITRLNIVVEDQVIRLTFDIVAEGNITIPEEYLGENIANLIESRFNLKNIPWIKLEHISIVKEGNVYYINGALTIPIDEIIKQGLEFNIITKTDAEEIGKCISEYYRNLNGIVVFNADIFTTNYALGASASIFKFEFTSDLYGEVKQINEVSRRCGVTLNKLFMIISFLITAIQTPQPQQPPITPSLMMFEAKPLNLKRVYPYKATAKLLVKLDAGNVVVNLTVDSGRITYVEDVDDPVMQAKLSLRELSSWIQQLDKQLSILALMGIPSPIPSTIEIQGVEEEGKSVIIEPGKTTVQGLGEVNVRIESMTKTTATPTPSTTITITLPTSPATTVTLTKTTTVTETYTATVTKTLTKTHTETLTMVETTTIVKEGLTTPNTIIVASIIVIVVVVLALLKTLRR